MTADSRVVSKFERQCLIDRLASIHPTLVRHLEEEVVDPYQTTVSSRVEGGLSLAKKWVELL